MRNTADVSDAKPIAVLLQSISGVSLIPLVAFYDIKTNEPWNKERGAIRLFCPGHHTSSITVIFNLNSLI
jgi:hypothetical protein